jgi:hypothetical protein
LTSTCVAQPPSGSAYPARRATSFTVGDEVVEPLADPLALTRRQRRQAPLDLLLDLPPQQWRLRLMTVDQVGEPRES